MRSSDFDRAVQKLEQYAYARNRSTDRELRHISLSDDEAVALLDVLANGVVRQPVPIKEGDPQRVRIVIEATLNGRYVRSVGPHLEAGSMVETTLEQRVGSIIRETITSGLDVTYLDGTGERIWQKPDWDWWAIETKAIDVGE